MRKERCKVCHQKTVPVSMERGDKITIYSEDGCPLVSEAKCGAPKGYVWDTCTNCGYILREYSIVPLLTAGNKN